MAQMRAAERISWPSLRCLLRFVDLPQLHCSKLMYATSATPAAYYAGADAEMSDDGDGRKYVGDDDDDRYDCLQRL